MTFVEYLLSYPDTAKPLSFEQRDDRSLRYFIVRRICAPLACAYLLKYVVTVFCSLSEPNNHTICPTIYSCHVSNLMASLFLILLIYANSIYPYPLNRATSETTKSGMKVLRDVEAILIDQDRSSPDNITPYVRQSLILNTRSARVFQRVVQKIALDRGGVVSRWSKAKQANAVRSRQKWSIRVRHMNDVECGS
jgi:hypothetical protein